MKLVEQCNAAGLHCAAAFSLSRLPILTAPMVIIDGTVTLSPAALGSCFGRDAAGNYYRCCAAEHAAVLEVYAPYLGGTTMIGGVVQKLLLALQTVPEGYNMHGIQVGSVRYDADSDCFSCPVEAQFTSFLCFGKQVTACASCL